MSTVPNHGSSWGISCVSAISVTKIKYAIIEQLNWIELQMTEGKAITENTFFKDNFSQSDLSKWSEIKKKFFLALKIQNAVVVEIAKCYEIECLQLFELETISPMVLSDTKSVYFIWSCYCYFVPLNQISCPSAHKMYFSCIVHNSDWVDKNLQRNDRLRRIYSQIDWIAKINRFLH